ncbi:cold-shock protein [Arenibaculum pallidiluteum]|uniref:cold-shock protein n=1 Tax=Arenibaculum pallidiluteum TaxID=2812559 RepID=UPI001A9676D2|nr:cold shock domain-containing protein [Arenibaculum pallidiluteum]
MSDGNTVRATVKWFDPSKGFGFVTPEDGSPAAFLHVSVLNRGGIVSVGEGAVLLCEIAPGGRGPQVTRLAALLDPGAPPGQRSRAEARTGAGAELTGTVKWFKPEKGFGFAEAEDGGKDVFIHMTVLRRCGVATLEPGLRVHMRVREAEKGREATWLALL